MTIMPSDLDDTDALGAVVCHYLQMKNPVSEKGAKNWEEFVKKNPGRVK